MATKIGGKQLRLEDFIKNPTPNGDWSSTLLTATQAAIKALVDGSGSIQYVGGGRTPTYINELAVGIYFVVENGMLYYNRDNYFSITQEGFLIVDGSNPYNDMGKGYHVICGNGEVHHGLAARSRTYSSHNIGYLNVMIGAADGWAGKSGNVPQPMAGDNHKFLKGDGTWGDLPVMEGADWWPTMKDGEKGLVPKPTFDDVFKCLKGSGQWGAPTCMFSPGLNPPTDSSGFYKHRIALSTQDGDSRYYSSNEIFGLIQQGYICNLFAERKPYENQQLICHGDILYVSGIGKPIFRHISVIDGKLIIGYYSCIKEDGVEYWIYNIELELSQ